MSLMECKRSTDVREVLASGHWPEACPTELREHVNSCRRCGDAVLVATTLRKARASALPERPVVSPSLIWWRAQLRQRQVVIQKVSRPLIGAQLIALMIVVCVACGLAAEAVHTSGGWQGLVHDAAGVGSAVNSFVSGVGTATLTAGAVMVALLGAVLVYAAFGRE
ncbi:MAG TPA: hypothetical protein VGN16_20485 [Acidobacteriaceae bacterium]|jgi:hypothetical protein